MAAAPDYSGSGNAGGLLGWIDDSVPTVETVA